MEQNSKNKLYMITIFLDIFLLYVLFFYNLNKFDFYWVLSVFLCHLLFYYNLLYYNRHILDILHYFVFILPSLSIFAENIVIKVLSIILLVLIQVLWIKENRCILNEEDTKFGYGDELNYYLIILTPILAYNTGKKIF